METATRSELARALGRELTSMAIAQFDSDEFRLVFDQPFTLRRARYLATQMVFYNNNRRECWAYVQARAPWDVKRVIWEHEKDELFNDHRAGVDHRSLMSKEALLLGVSEEELARAEPSPLVEAVMLGFCQASSSLPWLAGLTGQHFLERRNNSAIIPGGGWSKRIRDKLRGELGIGDESLVSTNVHIAADVDHSDAVWEAVAASVTDDYAYRTALLGASVHVRLDRAWRAAVAHEMRLL
jgi:hypothetical protein